MSSELQRLLDIEAIKQLKYRYIRLADEQRFEEWGRECFTEDCYVSTTEMGVNQGRDALVRAVSRGYVGVYSIHQVHMPDIAFTGPDTATGIWSLSDYTTFERNGVREMDWGKGRYDEDYVRTPEGWRISRSIYVRQSLPAPTRGVPVPEGWVQG